ncbi:MAG: hypothetical protein KAW88_09560, partial [Candidatus Cloacimonetes bacterium]|nr:hypothetical protein [Candidatus Cloacimonadota bacterium]
MKKNYFLILVLVSCSCLYSQPISYFSKIGIENTYNSNVLKLSSDDISKFKDGENPDKFKIDTIDDLITSARCEFGVKHRFLTGHTQIDKIVLKYNKFWSNEIKDDGYIGFEVKQFFSKRLNVALNYFYYPRIYLNQYKSVLDNESKYRDFTYSKNVYNARIFWKVKTKIHLNYRFEFSQLYYNKYFTEYDADNIESVIGLNFNTADWVKLGIRYSYKISDADAEDAFENPETVNVIKDVSYESDIYYCSFTFPEILILFSKPVNFSSNFRLENRFYQSREIGDDYH